MPRSLLDPAPITPVGSLGDSSQPNFATMVMNSTTTTGNSLGGMVVYTHAQEQQYFTLAEGGTNDDADAVDTDPQDGGPSTPEATAVKSIRNGFQDQKRAATVTAEFYFDKIKENMTRTQQQELRDRITDLTATLELASRDQQVLREETQRLLAVALLQQKAAVMGYDQVVSEDTINQFRSQVEMKRPEMMELRNFPRVMPQKVMNALNKAKKADLFDQFWVLTWNPQQEQVLAVTDRVIKKDPILFGKFAFDPFYLYYITSWIDETCDLTFDKMIASLKELHPDYEPARVKPLTSKDADLLIKAAQSRAAILAGTNQSRFRSDALVTSLENEQFSFAAALRIAKALLKQFSATRKRKKALPSFRA